MKCGICSYDNDNPYPENYVTKDEILILILANIICSRLNSSGAWRHSMTRDLGTDNDSMYSSRTGATLPRGDYPIPQRIFVV